MTDLPDAGLQVKRPDPVASAQSELRELLAQATIGEFQIYDQLGRGGMATVFLAHDIALDRPAAIKVMAPALMLEEGMAERFRREARTAANLNHPHIIPIYSVRQTDRLLFFVMKYVEGRPLDQIIKEFSPIPLESVQRILAQVGSALAYAHKRGVIHRDIKPANVMLDVDGWAIVADFGIARVAGSPSLTTSGSAVGTPHYMSPEQYNGVETTNKSDQYSLGVLAYEMITGRLPFPGSVTEAVIKGHLLDDPVPISELRPDCSPRLARVVTRMLEKEPERRWPSIDLAIAELHLPPVPEDDAVRTGLISLARSGPKRPRLPLPPESPVPPSRGKLGLGDIGHADSLGGSRWVSRSARRRLGLYAAGVTIIAVVGYLGISGLLAGPTVPQGSSSGQPAPTGTREASLPPSPPLLEGPAEPVSPPPPQNDPKPPANAQPPIAARRVRVPARTPMAAGAPSDTVAARTAPADSTPKTDTPRDTPAIAPAPTQWAWVYIGTRHESAFLYINGQIQVPKTPPLRWWRVPAGTVTLALSAEGCTAWEESRTIEAGDSVRIGYRFPTCPP